MCREAPQMHVGKPQATQSHPSWVITVELILVMQHAYYVCFIPRFKAIALGQEGSGAVRMSGICLHLGHSSLSRGRDFGVSIAANNIEIFF